MPLDAMQGACRQALLVAVLCSPPVRTQRLRDATLLRANGLTWQKFTPKAGASIRIFSVMRGLKLGSHLVHSSVRREAHA